MNHTMSFNTVKNQSFRNIIKAKISFVDFSNVYAWNTFYHVKDPSQLSCANC